MTDQDHAQAVRDAVAALNEVLIKAADSGLGVHIGTNVDQPAACGFMRTVNVFAEVVKPL